MASGIVLILFVSSTDVSVIKNTMAPLDYKLCFIDILKNTKNKEADILYKYNKYYIFGKCYKVTFITRK